MKKLYCTLALSLLLLPFAPHSEAQEASIDFFYNNLSGGSWVEVGSYGYCWQPDLAVSDSSWRPYADGYWAYTDLGWTWVSYEDFGWATYHYGRWIRLADLGWVWVPGYRWGPAWVSWRYGGNYVGWAPLPPETEAVYESRPLSGHLDVEFDIGPAYYNFVDVRYIGEPVLRSRIVPYQQNITYVNQTVNVTNITYRNKTVYNYGPDLKVVNQYSSRPIQTLKLERQTNVDAATAAKSGGLTKVQGNALVVAAPTEIKKAAGVPPPPKLKTKVEQPKIEKGWSVAGDENAQNQLKEKIKTQDLKNVPPATLGENAAAGANTSVAPSGSAAIAGSPLEKKKGKGKGKQADQFPATGANTNANPAGAMTSPAASPEFGKKGKRKDKADQTQFGSAASPMGSPSAESSDAVAPETGKQGKGRKQFGGMGMTPAPTAGSEDFGKAEGTRKGIQSLGPSPAASGNLPQDFNEPRGKRKQFEQPGMSSASQSSPAGPPQEGRGKHKQFDQTPSGMSPSGAGAAGPQGGPYGQGRGKHNAEGVNAPPTGGGENQPQSPPKHEGRGKGQGPATTATPLPQ